MSIPVLNDILVIFGLSIVVLILCHRLQIPAALGLLLTGVLAGPHGLRLIRVVHDVEQLAEIGVVLLLFTIGIEYSMKNLLRIKRAVLIGGTLQVLLTILVVFGVSRPLGLSNGASVFMGFLVALSSTAIVLKILQDRAELESPHGQTSLGILIYQDMIVVPMILVTPILAGASQDLGRDLLMMALKGAAVIAIVFLAARYFVPWLLYQIAKVRSRELFLLSIVAICLAEAWLTSSIGLSLALGAFLAGLIISESEYSHEALGNILPFRDIFTSFFFISIGMLLDIQVIVRMPGLVLLITLGLLLTKFLTGALSTILLGYPLRTAVLTGLALSQIGEFSFILSRAGTEQGLFEGQSYQLFLAVSIITMGATPFLIALSPRLADLTLLLPWRERLKSGLYPPNVRGDRRRVARLKDHVVIVGYGLNGRNLAKAAKRSAIPYIVIEMNPETVRKEKAAGEPIFYGDAAREAVLEHAGIRTARIAVIVISDAAAIRRMTALARRLNPKVHIIVRTRFVPEVGPLYELGANEVIPEEFETSVEIFSRVLTKYLLPKGEIDKLIADVRKAGYEMFRSPSGRGPAFKDLESTIPDLEISVIRVCDGAPIARKTLAQVQLRKTYGVTMVALRRGGKVVANPGAEIPIQVNDVVVMLGSPERLAEVNHLFQPAETPDRSCDPETPGKAKD